MTLAQPESTDNKCSDDQFIGQFALLSFVKRIRGVEWFYWRDLLLVSGGSPVPAICGTNTGAHSEYIFCCFSIQITAFCVIIFLVFFIFFDCKLWLVQMFYNVLTEDGHWAGRGRCCRGVEHLEWLLEYQYPASCSQLKLFGIVLNWDLSTYSVHTDNRSAWLGAGVVCVCHTRDCDPVRWTLHKDVNPMKKDHLSFQERFFEGTKWFFIIILWNYAVNIWIESMLDIKKWQGGRIEEKSYD